MSVTALMSTSAPTRNLVRGPVTMAASRVDTVVIDTERATSPFAMRVTRFDAVPPGGFIAKEGGGGEGGHLDSFLSFGHWSSTLSRLTPLLPLL